MTTRGLTYALVTPARDERDNLPRLAASVLGQTVLPQAWVVVDDHSRDGSLELVQGLATEHPLVRARAWDGPGGGALSEGRREGRDLHASASGSAASTRPSTSSSRSTPTRLRPDYFERLLGALRADARLGIAGGACLELEDGAWVRRSTTATHPRGASRAYRWACVADLMALEPRMGWDGLDEVKVGLRGYRTASSPTSPSATTGRGRPRAPPPPRAGAVRARVLVHGLPPELPRAARAAPGPDRPGRAGDGLGLPAEAVRRSPRCGDPAVVAAVQERQALTSLLRHGLPART